MMSSTSSNSAGTTAATHKGKRKSGVPQSFLTMFLAFVILAALCTTAMFFAPTNSYVRFISAVSLAIFMILAGVNHFIAPRMYLPLMPPFFHPYEMELIYISGVAELIGGILILIPNMTNIGAYSIMIILFAVFPANVWMALSEDSRRAFGASTTSALVRLPLQALFLLWAYQLTDRSVMQTVQTIIAGKPRNE